MKKHTPVLVEEVIEWLEVKEGKKYIDATFGFGGHSSEIKKRGGIVLGIDADPQTGAVHGNFRDIKKIAKDNGFEEIDGILFDLGVSSYQLDTPERGFSYQREGPLDLRFDQGQGVSAAEIVNKSSENELYEIFLRFGEEQLAGTIAHSVVRARRVEPIRTTGQLARVTGVDNATLSRIFQALRIVVNDELEALKEGLKGAEKLLKPGGRLAVISFHSLEDRIVKQFMRKTTWQLVTKHPVRPSEKEIKENSRSRSAKLRIAEKVT